ncbi:MAG: DUF4040 domain-containing protein [Actinobacteria bacterium]|nr:DUF4040 domain-containing protein [Actinomycetota bacterium]MDP9021531.1 DUF4040 domain-containing protein [Actinomycetota bacterium]
MTPAHVLALLLVAAAGTAVVATRDPVRQSVVASVFGSTLAVLFLLFEAPGVAMAMIVVGIVAVPVMVLFTMAAVRANQR